MYIPIGLGATIPEVVNNISYPYSYLLHKDSCNEQEYQMYSVAIHAPLSKPSWPCTTCPVNEGYSVSLFEIFIIKN